MSTSKNNEGVLTARRSLSRLIASGLFALMMGCHRGQGDEAPMPLPPAGGPCSDLTKVLAWWQGREYTVCGNLDFRSVITFGDGSFVLWSAITGYADLWHVDAKGSLSFAPLDQYDYSSSDRNRLLVAIRSDRLLEFDQASSTAKVLAFDALVRGSTDPTTPKEGTRAWPRVLGGHGLLSLEPNVLLDWEPGTGNTNVVRYSEDSGPQFIRSDACGQKDVFKRGHRLLALGDDRLLEWQPGQGAYRIWNYDLARLPGDIWDPEPAASGESTDLADAQELFIPAPGVLMTWDRKTGTLSSRLFVGKTDNPFAGEVTSTRQDDRFRSRSFPELKATQSRVKRALIVLQQGRAFDTYFGGYCEAEPGAEPVCEDGAKCCEAMPRTVGGASCRTLADDDDYAPDASATCLREKSTAWSEGTLETPSGCGSAEDCSFVDPKQQSQVAKIYHDLARRGVTADRYFSSLADTAESNLLFFATSSPGTTIREERSTSLAGLLSAAGVPFAMYVENLSVLFGQTAPVYLDGNWAHFRALDELADDIASDQLPQIALVIAGAESNEAPGISSSLTRGTAWVDKVVGLVTKSERYADDTLTIVTHLSSGGFYDHVPPPKPDSFCDNVQIGVGSRVPFVALGPFVRPNTVSHVSLDHASLTAFAEWNWLGGISGQLGGRDACAGDFRQVLLPAAVAASQ